MPKDLKTLVREEWVKCAKDPVYFFKKYCYIQHPHRGKILFNLYPFQETLMDDVNDNRFNVILKSRQLGISTLSAGYSLWLMLFHEDKNILVIATKQEVAKNLVTKVRFMHDNLPSWLKGQTEEDNKLSLRLRNGSQIKATSAAGDAGRSEALSMLIIDEAAFISNVEEIWTSAQSTLSTGGGAIVLSTPNGVGNWFHKVWVAGQQGEQWHPTELHWTVHPERNQVWRDEQEKLLGAKGAAQECDCDFISSGHTVVEGATLQWYEETYVKDPLEKRGFDGNYWLWEYPNYSRDYVVVADVARGDSSDYSAFHVFDVETVEQVAEYKGKIDTKQFGAMLTAVANEWNKAMLVIENANIGWAVIQEVIDRSYENLYYSYRDIGYVDEDIHLRKGFDLKRKEDMVPGFSMTSRTRPLVISKLDMYMRERTPIIRSKRLIDELFVFIWNGSRAEAQRGYNDDLVMSFSTGLWVRDTALKLRQQGLDLSRTALSHIGKSTGGVYNARSAAQDPWNQKDQHGNDNDLTWLL
jgi:hypothetical protein|tara:strand:- start:1619 stop:3193 length:1575 start_codon:yes stop_codon:yes gene_type:complete